MKGILLIFSGIAALVLLSGCCCLDYFVTVPAPADSCTGSAKFTVNSVSNSGGNLLLIMTNLTGQQISNVSMVTDNGVQGAGIPDLWNAGVTDEIVFSNAIASAGDYSVTITITYEDIYGGQRTETISCTGIASG